MLVVDVKEDYWVVDAIVFIVQAKVDEVVVWEL